MSTKSNTLFGFDLTVIPLSLAYSLAFCSNTFLPIWLPGMAKIFGVNSAQIGLVGSLELGSIAVSSILTAHFAKHAGIRSRITIAILVNIVANSVTSLAPSLLILALLRAVVGLANGVLFADTVRAAAGMRNPRTTFSVQQFVLVLFAILFFSNVPFLMGHFGVAAPFWFSAALGVLAAISLPLLQVAPKPVVQHHAAGGKPSRLSMPVLLIFASSLTAFCIQAGTWATIGLAGTRVGMPLAVLAKLFAVASFVMLAVPFLVEGIGDRLGRMTPFALGFGVLAVSEWLIGGQLDPFLFSAGVIGLNLAAMFLGPFSMALLVEYDPSGTSAAAGPAIIMLGASTGPAVAGILLRLVGSSGFAAAGVASCLTAFALVVLSRRHHRAIA